MSLWRKISRSNKKAAKFRFVASFQELSIECSEKWQPARIQVAWVHRRRRTSTKCYRWEPSITDPYRGLIVWPDGSETLDITTTLYRDTRDAVYDDKEWAFIVEEVRDGNARRPRTLAAVPLNLRLFIHELPGTKTEVKLKLRPLHDGVRSCIMHLTLTSEMLKEGDATAEDMQSVASAMSVQKKGVGVAAVGGVAGNTGEDDVANLADFDEFGSAHSGMSGGSMKDKSENARLKIRELAGDIAEQWSGSPDEEGKPTKHSTETPSATAASPTTDVEPIRLVAEVVYETAERKIELHLPVDASANIVLPPSSQLNAADCAVVRPTTNTPQKKPKQSSNDSGLGPEPRGSIASQSTPIKDDTAGHNRLSSVSTAASLNSDELLQWCKEVTKGYFPKVKIQDWSKSWRNGLAFCAVIHKYHPDLIGDFQKLNSRDIVGNCRLAFDAAATLGVPRLIQPSDMQIMAIPDQLAVMCYMHGVHRALVAPVVSASPSNTAVADDITPFRVTQGRQVHAEQQSSTASGDVSGGGGGMSILSLSEIDREVVAEFDKMRREREMADAIDLNQIAVTADGVHLCDIVPGQTESSVSRLTAPPISPPSSGLSPFEVNHLLGRSPLHFKDMQWPMSRPERLPIRLPLEIATQQCSNALQRLRVRYYAALLFTVPLEGVEDHQLRRLIAHTDPELLEEGDDNECICRKISLLAADTIRIEVLSNGAKQPIKILHCRFDVVDEEFAVNDGTLSCLMNSCVRHKRLREVYDAERAKVKVGDVEGLENSNVEEFVRELMNPLLKQPLKKRIDKKKEEVLVPKEEMTQRDGTPLWNAASFGVDSHRNTALLSRENVDTEQLNAMSSTSYSDVSLGGAPNDEGLRQNDSSTSEIWTRGLLRNCRHKMWMQPDHCAVSCSRCCQVHNSLVCHQCLKFFCYKCAVEDGEGEGSELAMKSECDVETSTNEQRMEKTRTSPLMSRRELMNPFDSDEEERGTRNSGDGEASAAEQSVFDSTDGQQPSTSEFVDSPTDATELSGGSPKKQRPSQLISRRISGETTSDTRQLQRARELLKTIPSPVTAEDERTKELRERARQLIADADQLTSNSFNRENVIRISDLNGTAPSPTKRQRSLPASRDRTPDAAFPPAPLRSSSSKLFPNGNLGSPTDAITPVASPKKLENLLPKVEFYQFKKMQPSSAAALPVIGGGMRSHIPALGTSRERLRGVENETDVTESPLGATFDRFKRFGSMRKQELSESLNQLEKYLRSASMPKELSSMAAGSPSPSSSVHRQPLISEGGEGADESMSPKRQPTKLTESWEKDTRTPEEISSERHKVEMKQKELNPKADAVERRLREVSAKAPGGAEETSLMSEYLQLLNAKNYLVKKEDYLNTKESLFDNEQRFSHVRLELAKLLKQDEDEKTEADKRKIDQLMEELIGLVNRKDELAQQLITSEEEMDEAAELADLSPDFA